MHLKSNLELHSRGEDRAFIKLQTLEALLGFYESYLLLICFSDSITSKTLPCNLSTLLLTLQNALIESLI